MSLVHNVAVTNNSFELVVPTRQAVHKRLEYIRYGRVVPAQDVPLEYIAFNPLTARNTLAIAYLGAEFRNNNKRVTRSSDEAVALTVKKFTTDTSNVLITSQYRVLDNGSVVPYFYSHALPDNTQSVTMQKVTYYIVHS
jgi:hypothetical protein